MIYLKNFKLPNNEMESNIRDPRQIYNGNYYPLGLFSSKELTNIDFENITIFYGTNGSGKTTLLNVISNKLNASRNNGINKGTNFDNYVSVCKFEMSDNKPSEIKVISSDDVFDYLLDIRSINSHINRRKDILGEEWIKNKYTSSDYSINDYEKIKASYDARHQTQSAYIRNRLSNNLVEQSNGESALMFWEREIKENAIYLLDEPENSLSADNQLKLKQFIEDSARFYNCQFIISTHSPFLLNLLEAKIYNLDQTPVSIQKWSELPNMKLYYEFFKERKDEFENEN